MPPRSELMPVETVAHSGSLFELRVRFPEGTSADDATWSVEGDLLAVEHAGLHPPYHREFLVPAGWRLVAAFADGGLSIRLTPS